MIQTIDEAYIAQIYNLPDGPKKLLDWFTSMLEQRDTAEAIAKACVAQTMPLNRRIEDLLAANNRLVFEKRDLRTELQAEVDAAHAKLDQHRGMGDFLEVQDTPEEASQLLAWFTMRTDLDLSYQYDLEPHQIPRPLMKGGGIPEQGWVVHKSHGGRNDREWDMVALEETAIEALRAAHRAFCDGR